MMARRMMRKHHVRCRAGEKVEITSQPYLSLSILVECGKMLQRGAPKLGKDGKPMKDKHGKVIYEPYRIKAVSYTHLFHSLPGNSGGKTAGTERKGFDVCHRDRKLSGVDFGEYRV